MKNKYKQELQLLTVSNNLIFNAQKFDLLVEYANFIVLKNSMVNLISRKDIDNVIENHIFHSVLISKYFPDKVKTCLDFGTGGGLPGIPLSICFPEIHFVLLDSIKKKVSAVQEFINNLNLTNCSTECDRIESEIIQKKYSNFFDLIVSRATVNLKKLLEFNITLLKSRGYIISIKGGILSEEIKESFDKFEKNIKFLKIVNLFYKPTNTKNEKDKKLIILEIQK